MLPAAFSVIVMSPRVCEAVPIWTVGVLAAVAVTPAATVARVTVPVRPSLPPTVTATGPLKSTAGVTSMFFRKKSPGDVWPAVGAPLVMASANGALDLIAVGALYLPGR